MGCCVYHTMLAISLYSFARVKSIDTREGWWEQRVERREGGLAGGGFLGAI